MGKLNHNQRLIISIVCIVVFFALCIFLSVEVYMGVNYGTGIFPTASCYHSPIDLLNEPYEIETTKLSFDNNGDTIKGTLYMPKDGREVREILIYTHGYNGTSSRLKNFAKSFAYAGIAVVTFDFRYGASLSRSDIRTWKMSIDTEMSDLNVVIDEVKKWDFVNKDEIYIGGQSLGGLVCGLVAPNRDDIKAMCLCYPAFDEADYIRDRFPSEDDIPNYFFENMLVGKDYLLSLHRRDIYELIKPYEGPVLIIHGTEDDDVAYESSVKACEGYKDATLVTIEGAGHGFGGDDWVFAIKTIYEFIEDHIDKSIITIT